MSIPSIVLLVSIIYFPRKIYGEIGENNGLWDTTITVTLNKTYQIMKGFGTFAGSADFIFDNPKREEFIDLLFGDDGLKLTVIRSTLPANFNLTNFNNKNSEIWIQKRAKNKHGVSKFMTTAWSPPYKWKSRKGQSTGAHMNMLLEKYYDDFANYIADYVEFRKRIGLDLYAVSPQNEPEFATPNWDGCVWWPQQTAKFVRNNLKPMLVNRNLSTKVIIGENANWNVADLYLSCTSLMLRNQDFDIYASHGYSLPEYPSFKYVTYNQHVLPWLNMYDKERWITEASSTEKFDSSMKKGIQFAVSLSRFLTQGNINGYIFWCGVVGSESNEGLIVGNKTGVYILPRVYHVYGHFSRHIKPGYVRVKATKSFFPLESDLEFAALKDPTTNAFTVILTNYAEMKHRRTVLHFKGTRIDSKSIKAIVTDKNKEWAPIIYNVIEEAKISLTVPPMSVITITGTVKSFK